MWPSCLPAQMFKPFLQHQFQNYISAEYFSCDRHVFCVSCTASVLSSLKHVAWNIIRRQLPSDSLSYRNNAGQGQRSVYHPG